MRKNFIISTGVLVLIIIGVILGFSMKSNASAQQIPDNSRFSQVKKLSRGTRPQCLSDNKTAHSAVAKIKSSNEMSSFDLVMSSRIIDMPAGYTTTTVHTFDGITASGTNSYTDKNQQAFAGDLKYFNFVVQLYHKTNDWKLTSYIACNS